MTTPQQVLSDEQIEALIGSPWLADYARQGWRDFARAIESATLAALGGQPVAWRWMPSQEFPMWVYSDDKARVMEALRFMGLGGVQPLYTHATLPPAQPAPAPVDEREAFEAAMIDKHGWQQSDFKRDAGGYFDGHTATAWLAWQARAALQAPAPQTKGGEA